MEVFLCLFEKYKKLLMLRDIGKRVQEHPRWSRADYVTNKREEDQSPSRIYEQKHQTFRKFRKPFLRATSANILAACTRARVPHMMTQFVLKIEKLSHIIGTAPILEMARAYGVRPRLWLPVMYSFVSTIGTLS